MEEESENEILKFEENSEEYLNFEGERCGICMDIVIDRGVLDCCQHWFCFTCIDNWASITNLCPLCQHAFQSITCVPVYDTIGGDIIDEDSYSRDDDWSIEGKNSTLSFPSYYIDESAVICLDGDGCKIRSEPERTETNSNLDTSIACDSCDIWYHAFCVGFDPECTSENSWLCPRCLVDQVPRESDDVSASTSRLQQRAEETNGDCSAEETLSGKIVVSVADAGETAVVVSLLEEKQGNEELGANQSAIDIGKGTKSERVLSTSPAISPVSGALSSGMISCEPYTEPKKPGGFCSQTTCFDLPVDPVSQGKEQKHIDAHEICSSETCVSHVDVDDMKTKQAKGLPMNRVLPGQGEGIVNVTVAKQKHIGHRSARACKSKARDNGKIVLKKVEVEGGSQLTHLKDQCNAKDTESRSCLENEEVTTDIMDIVQGPGRRRMEQPASTNFNIRSSKERENAAGLRMKKIMKRTSDPDSTVVVQKLRKEIREAVGNKSAKDIGENLFDPKLLAAFRAVVAGNTIETKKQPVDMKAKKAIFQKGKVRENLTRKIYGTGGKRKRAWTRDCEVEFWKYRCSKLSKPEKIQTLQSVLDLLRDDTDKRITTRRKVGEPTDSLLSRLYLADTSVFPRKDDVKPVSALDIVTVPEQSKEKCSSQKFVDVSPKVDLATISIVPPANQLSEKSISIIKGETASSNLPKNKCTEGTPVSRSGDSKASSQQEKVSKSDVKSDKRKWALEVLARKTAVTNKHVAQDTAGDSPTLKGNFPKLALLPKDMRPILAQARHNKIPNAVRQTQLYRLAENFLKKINLPAMLKTAETELAVADAINVERGIADRSNSKLVYVNLCSQELLRRTDSRNNEQTTTTDIPQTMLAQSREAEITNDDFSDPDINEALRNAGLLSDTPPSSPCELVEENKDFSFPEKVDDDGPDDVFEMDCQAALDIYGDFEYNLEDDDFIGASTLKESRLVQEESKMKVIFSTLSDDKSKGSVEFQSRENSAISQASQGSSSVLENSTSNGNSNIENTTDGTLDQNSTMNEEVEPSVAECEELYGPDREPLIMKHPEMASLQPQEVIAGGETGSGYETHASCEVVKSSEPNSEHPAENLDDISKRACIPVSLPCGNNAQKGNLQDKEINASASLNVDDVQDKEKNASASDSATGSAKANKQSDGHPSVSKKVEAYIKEHVRPLWKSSVITVEQYRWAVRKTTEKVMKYHSKDKDANFLIKEGEKVKKLAGQYVKAAPANGR